MPVKRLDTCIECGAPRDPKATTARCTEHNRQYRLERLRASRAARPGISAEHSRLRDYRIAAEDAGADEVEVAWIMMACEIEFRRNGRSSGWVRSFVAAELAYLRENADVMARLDARPWQPVRGDMMPVIDDGYDDQEVA